METPKNPALFVCPEIWEIIFDKLQCQNDKDENPMFRDSELYNCSQVCVTFQNILYPTRTTWLFREIFPYLFRYLDGKSVLSCRASCKSWKLAVDHFLENQQDYLNLHHEKCYLLPTQFYWYPFENDECELLSGTREWKKTVLESSIHLRSSTQLSQFLELFSGHTGNPFPGRTLRVINIGRESNARDAAKFWTVDMVQLLCRLGDQIHNLHLGGIDHDENTIPYLLPLIFQLLSLTPNLKRLRLEGIFLMGVNDEYYNGQLEMFLIDAPKIPSLESLEFARNSAAVLGWELSGPPLPLQQAILTPYSRHLKKLQLSLLEMPYHTNWSTVLVPGVEELTLKVACFTQFASFFSPECAYTKLRVVIIEIVGGKHVLGDYLRILHRFMGSLKVFRFTVYHQLFPHNEWQVVRVSKSDLSALRELENLEYLQIQGFKFGNVDVVGSLPSKLKYLLLDYKGELCRKWRDFLGPGVSEDLEDEQGIYASELWRKFPRLRWLRVAYFDDPIRMYVYRRENWEMWLQGKRKCHKGPWALRAFRVRRSVVKCVRSLSGRKHV